MARQNSHYSTFLTGWQNLVGVSTSIGLSTDVAAVANSAFNTAISQMWTNGHWMEACPYGEARFLGNRLTYPNDYTKTAYWTATALTVTAKSIANPADGFVTANKLMETSANSAHSIVQSVTNFFPSTGYTISFRGRPNGRNWQYISVYDGVTTYTAFFNVSAGTVGTFTNFQTATIAQQPNGFWLCQVTFTANANATSAGTFTWQLSTDGVTTSYAGDATKGGFLWGALIQQSTNIPVQDSLLAWDQVGENAIDTIYNMWPGSPFAANYPRQLGYDITPAGIQVVNGTPYNSWFYVGGVAQSTLYGPMPWNPIFIYYRKTVPSFTGDPYDSTATYAVDAQIYFTTSAGFGDFYKCTVATMAGQSPDTTPTSWEIIPLPDTFVQWCIYQAYGDWLISDGQMDKAQAAYAIAQSKMDAEFDKMERQMDTGTPMVVTNHLTSRPPR